VPRSLYLLFGLQIGCLFRGDLREERLLQLTDADVDGFTADIDCDDNDASEHPEVIWYADADADEYGDPNSASECARAAKTDVTNNLDCNDQAKDEFPGQVFHFDGDGDTFGHKTQTHECSRKGTGSWVLDGTDCDDDDTLVNPGADEICDNSVDDNCDDLPNDCDGAGEHPLTSVALRFEGTKKNSEVGETVASAGDVNADGFQDLWISAPGRNTVYLVHGGPNLTGDLDLKKAAASQIEVLDNWNDPKIANAGDVDGDGLPDVIISANDYPDPAAVYLVTGGFGAADISSAASTTIVGDNSSLGHALSGAGDVNQDGLDDFLVGSLDGAYLFHGPGVQGQVHPDDADAIFVSKNSERYHAGDDVAAAGDVNSDGVPDLLIGSPNDWSKNSITGLVHVVFGPVEGTVHLADADVTLRGEYEDDGTGETVASAGDHNGDGADDILVGSKNANWSSGRAYLVHSPSPGTIDLGSADAIMSGRPDNGHTGTLLGAADVNMDQQPDIWVSDDPNSYPINYANTTFVMLGPVSGTVDLLTSAHERWWGNTSDVASLGDFNGDGADDLAVGNRYENNYRGQVHIVLGTNW
jgi:hypothetical protein